MMCLGLEPGAPGWKAQTNPLSYGGTPCFIFLYLQKCTSTKCLPIKVKIVHLEKGTGFQTHIFSIMSLFLP